MGENIRQAYMDFSDVEVLILKSGNTWKKKVRQKS